MKQKRQRRASQNACRPAATRISSFTAAGRLHEPALLLDEAGGGPGRPRGDGVVGLAAQQGDGPLLVEPAQLVAAHLLQARAGLLPRAHPPPRVGDLLRSPPCEGSIVHAAIIDAPHDAANTVPRSGRQASARSAPRQSRERGEQPEPVGRPRRFRVVGIAADYPIFMAVAEKVGFDRRGATLHKRSPEGEEIVVVKEEAETVTRNGRTVTRTLRRREKIVDDDLPEIAERYRAFRREHPEPC